jgi:hypothetical protein
VGKSKKENRGGYRPNAKRPLKYGEPTVQIRFSVPESKADYFTNLFLKELKKLEIK